MTMSGGSQAVWDGAFRTTPAFFWTPIAINYLVELIMAAILAGYLGWRVLRNPRELKDALPTIAMAIMMGAMVVAIAASLFRALAGGGWLSYAMPWAPSNAITTLLMPWARPFGGLTAAMLCLLAYLFPRPLVSVKWEFRIIGTLIVILILIEAVVALESDFALLRQMIWWRPEWLSSWMALSVFWAATLFWRQFLSAIRATEVAGTARSRLGRTALELRAFFRPTQSREASAARALLGFTALPIVHTFVLFLNDRGHIGNESLEVIICWLGLTQLVGFALVLVGYLPERTSLTFKLTVTSIALVLASVATVAWVTMQSYAPTFTGTGFPSQDQRLGFAPDGRAGYKVYEPRALPPVQTDMPVTRLDHPIALPFAFPFFGRHYRAITLGPYGSVGFDGQPAPASMAFANGLRPGIFPLLVTAPPEGTDLTVNAQRQRFVITRRDRCAAHSSPGCHTIQTTLFADGRIEIAYLDTPATYMFNSLDPISAPWLTGITPGAGAAPAKALIHDNYREYLTHLDRIYSSYVGLVIGLALVVMLGVPAILRAFLIAPLDRLLDGIRQFRGGRLTAQVPVSFADEVGYLTESFNEMAETQRAILQDLEDRVAQRVAEVEAMTIRQAQAEERGRLSAELHDSVAQTLATASMLAGNFDEGGQAVAPPGHVETMRLVSRLNRHALTEMRILLRELRGEWSNDQSLDHRLAELIATTREFYGVTVDHHYTQVGHLPAQVSAILFRVAQECLNNVVKHSGVRRAVLSVEGSADAVRLIVSDDGAGFDPDGALPSSRIGLAVMRERARSIGATIAIESGPARGCTVTMQWQRPDDAH